MKRTLENRLSVVKLRALKPAEKEQTFADGGGLWLRVQPVAMGGAISFYYRYEFDGKERRFTLGSYPELSLSEARSERDKLRANVAEGINPALERAREKRERIVAAHVEHSRLTVRQLFDRWEQQYLQGNRKDAGKEARRIFERDVFGRIGKLPAESVRRRDVVELLDHVVQRRARRVANILLALLRQMFQFALVREYVPADPTIGIRKKDVGGEERHRERVLATQEIVQLARQLPEAALGVHVESAIWIMLTTACRVGELSRARWDEVDLIQRTWTIPPESAKNRRQHLIHLSARAAHEFEKLRALRTCEWIIPNREVSGPIEQKAIGKQIRDRQRPRHVRGRTERQATLVLEGGTWTAHDLRRTAATLLGELGIRPDVIDRCLNHVEQNRMIRTYQRQELLRERQEAFEALGGFLDSLVTGEAARVVSLDVARRRRVSRTTQISPAVIAEFSLPR